MGLLDGILGNVVGSVLGGGAPQPQARNPLGDILARVGQGGFGQGGFGQAGVGQAGTGQGASLLMAALTMLIQNGGLSKVLEVFRQSGMGDQADSWVGTGANAGISSDQVEQVFGGSLGSLATQFGMSKGQASSAMAQLLPELINQLTPEGVLPPEADDLLSRGLSMLRGGGNA